MARLSWSGPLNINPDNPNPTQCTCATLVRRVITLTLVDERTGATYMLVCEFDNTGGLAAAYIAFELVEVIDLSTDVFNYYNLDYNPVFGSAEIAGVPTDNTHMFAKSRSGGGHVNGNDEYGLGLITKHTLDAHMDPPIDGYPGGYMYDTFGYNTGDFAVAYYTMSAQSAPPINTQMTNGKDGDGAHSADIAFTVGTIAASPFDTRMPSGRNGGALRATPSRSAQANTHSSPAWLSA